MTEEELGRYFKTGEKVRIRAFLKSMSNNEKDNLRAELKLKLKQDDLKGKRQHSKAASNKKTQENTNLRSVEIGWMLEDDWSKTEMKKKQGGGTRIIQIYGSAKKEDILAECLKFFFPNGKSSKGKEEDFEFDIGDFQGICIEKNETVANFYKKTGLKRLRFYLISRLKNSGSPEDVRSSDSEDALPSIQKRPRIKFTPLTTEVHSNSDAKPVNPATSFSDSVAGTSFLDPHVHSSPKTSSNVNILQEAAMHAGIFEDDNEVDFPGIHFRGSEILDDTILYANIPGTVHHVRVHRGLVFKELTANFKNIDVLRDVVEITVVLPNGISELAEDNGGVTRDILTEYWESFYEEATLGSAAKVPCLRHDFGSVEWASVAKVIIFGWKKEGYFPVLLAKPFVECCLYGDVTSSIIDSFFSFIAESDKNILQQAKSDIDSVDSDELYDVLGNYDIRTIPNKDNFGKILEEISHKEIIQSGMFIIDSWRPLLKNIGITPEQLRNIYFDLVPNNKRVIQRLKFPEPMTPEQITTANHLKRFVRELDVNMLKDFLRYCTGSHLLISNNIEVNFVDLKGLARRPVAHTCGCVLEIPTTYESFPQFRSEFLTILKSAVWVMDIV